jgi:spore germination cell wall hydrolase CwlJ-like protein
MRLDLCLFATSVAIIISSVLGMTALDLRADRLQDRQADIRATRSMVSMERQLACMTKNIYWEAASEPAEGKIAVAQVVMNRVEHEDFPDSVCEVVYQRDVIYTRVVCQFSWYCMPGFTDRRINEEAWQESEAAAKKVMLEGFRLPSLTGALYYHADYVNPQWRLDRITQIGRHIFYEPRDKQI